MPGWYHLGMVTQKLLDKPPMWYPFAVLGAGFAVVLWLARDQQG